jgi:hypothetical protein
MDPGNPKMFISLWHKDCPNLPPDWDGDSPEYKLMENESEVDPFSFIYSCELCGTLLHAGFTLGV